MKLKLNLTLSAQEQRGRGEGRVPSTETDRSGVDGNFMQRWKGLANVCSGIFKPQELHDQVNKTKQKKNVISRERSGVTGFAFCMVIFYENV